MDRSDIVEIAKEVEKRINIRNTLKELYKEKTFCEINNFRKRLITVKKSIKKWEDYLND